ncbi:MAG: HIT domain-containing protein, partial [Clostridia bacterium]|nr:HIT domain-containing protein [Clostridia bacterium]
HYKFLADMSETDREILGKCFATLASIAKSVLGLENGYRLIINQGDDAGQTVFHLHVHILAGQPLDFPDLKKQ